MQRPRITLRLVGVLALAAIVSHAAPPVLLGFQPSPTEPGLLEAKQAFDIQDYERVVATLERILPTLEARPRQDPLRKSLLSAAYEMRARSRFGLGDREGARGDFTSLLLLAPAHQLTGLVSPNVVALFLEVKKVSVGMLDVSIEPSTVEVLLDGAPLTVTSGVVPVAAGQHTLVATQAGYRTANQVFTVDGGGTATVNLVLERVSATVTVSTSPPDVDVFLDGVARGRTLPAPATSIGQSTPPPASQPMILPDIGPGVHVLEFRRPCHVRAERRIDIPGPKDYRLDPVKLEPAVATVSLQALPPGATILIDNEPQAAPATGSVWQSELCEGQHAVDVRTVAGRFARRVDAKAGDALTMDVRIKPSVAVLSVSGLPEGLRGGPDLRAVVERVLADARSIAFYAPTAEESEQTMKADDLSASWLSFDAARRPIGEAPANITASARLELSTRLARRFQSQGVATVTVASREDRMEVFLNVLASGSGEPDIVEVKLDSPDSVAAAIARLDGSSPLFRSSIGLVTIDVLGINGAVVAAVEPNGPSAGAGVLPGQIIANADSQPVASVAKLTALLEARKGGDRFVLDIRDAAGATKRVEVPVASVPRLVSLDDQTRLFNKLTLDLRARILETQDPLEESVARLNLAVALMRLTNFTGAREELEKVRLPEGPGISNGTVQYLLGVCHESLGQFASAEAAWRTASASDGLLVEDGLTVKEAAHRKLANLQGLSHR